MVIAGIPRLIGMFASVEWRAFSSFTALSTDASRYFSNLLSSPASSERRSTDTVRLDGMVLTEVPPLKTPKFQVVLEEYTEKRRHRRSKS
jgi:hypothetical protein